MPPSHPVTELTPAAPTDRSGVRRSFNEAAHKLGYWPVGPAATANRPSGNHTSELLRSAADDDRDVVAHAGKAVLALGALGIVYGDIGTSPLYTVQTIFTAHAAAVHTTQAGVFGISSLIFWALTIVVSVKYAGFIMRAHNRGDGGIMALAALIRRRKVPHALALTTLGIFGAGLFFGDGMITPAVSVISAVEGLDIAAPAVSHLVIPITLVILIGLFAFQRFGTGAVGWLFGPVILLWFVVIAALGAHQVVLHPAVLQALSPVWGARFMIDHGVAAFLTLGAVVLCVTGAEALYADRGHFGAGPIRFTWFAVVFPAVLLNYLGQGALVLAHPGTVSNPFYLLAPSELRLPLVILATVATIIASQAAITGSFSVAKQAIQLGFLPRLKVVHTSNLEGQIYVPIINWFLCLGVVTLVLVFRSSARLTDIYGVAVTGTFILNTILFTAIARAMWKTPWSRLAPLSLLFLSVEVSFFSSNLAKVAHGAWLSLAVGLAIAFVMITWRRGREMLTANRAAEEGSLQTFLDELCASPNPPERVAGTAVFLAPNHRHDTARAAGRGRSRPRAAGTPADGVGDADRHRPHRRTRPLCRAHARARAVTRSSHVTIRVGYREARRYPGRAGHRAQARAAGTQPRPGARLLLGLTDVDRRHPRRRGCSGGARRCSCSWPATHRVRSSSSSLPPERTVMMGTQVMF